MTLARRAILAGAFWALAACAELTGFSPPQTAALPLVDGSVIAAVPEGYCIETGASRPVDGFAVMAACTVLAGQGPLPALNGVVTVQVAEAGSGLGGDAAALRGLLGTAAGRALLSSSGTAADITVRDTALREGVVTVRFVDRAAPPIAGLQQTEWRGFFDLNGRLTTVAVRGLAEAPLGTDDGQVLLQSVIRAMQQINAGREIVVET